LYGLGPNVKSLAKTCPKTVMILAKAGNNPFLIELPAAEALY
jgi:hypothetical protein